MIDAESFSDLVKRARSTRRFVEAEQMPAALLHGFVDLARLTPCGSNSQPLRYRIVSQSAERSRVFPHVRWASLLRDWSGPAPGERPAAYIAVLAARGLNVDSPVGIAALTIQLAATAAGVGACMLTNIDRTAVHQVLELPQDLSVAMLVALGRPAETAVIEPMPKDGSTAYWRTPDDVVHVPKRSLDEVLIPPPPL
jgi:nitroreductase